MWISSNHDESYSHPGLQWAIFSLFEWWQEAFFDPFVRFDKLVIRSKSFRVVDFLNSPRFFFTITWKVELEGNENELFYEYWGKEKTREWHILNIFRRCCAIWECMMKQSNWDQLLRPLLTKTKFTLLISVALTRPQISWTHSSVVSQPKMVY